jgi:hypothetical protein
MPTFTVHQPPPRKDESAADPERFAFVRDGFHFWAFVLAPLWLIAHRLWLVLVLYVLLTAAVDVGLALLGASTAMQVAVSLCIALLVGLEASTLRRWTLQRRKWKMLGFVVGDDEEAAERRFYAEWSKAMASPSVTPAAAPVAVASRAPVYAAPVRRGPPSASDVIGLFPEPGSPR